MAGCVERDLRADSCLTTPRSKYVAALRPAPGLGTCRPCLRFNLAVVSVELMSENKSRARAGGSPWPDILHGQGHDSYQLSGVLKAVVERLGLEQSILPQVDYMSLCIPQHCLQRLDRCGRCGDDLVSNEATLRQSAQS